jgi:hypothetical protein
MNTSGKVGEGNAFCGERERVRAEKKELRDETGSILMQHVLIITGMKYLTALLQHKRNIEHW